MAELTDRFEFTVRWEPFLLRPDMPLEGMPKPASYTDPNNPRISYLKQAGSAVGCDFTNKSPIIPNTLKAHALMEYAKNKDGGSKQNDVAETLFQAYFKEGKLDDAALLNAAQSANFDRSDVNKYITDETVINNVKAKAKDWSRKGVSGVPYFYVNGEAMFSGAQDASVFKKVFEKAAEKFPVSRN